MVDTQRSPPLYSTDQDGASSPPPKHPIPEGVKPTNLIQISTVDSVRGVWIIDPAFTPPAPLMSPTFCQKDRKNVLIESLEGNVNVDLFVLPSHYFLDNKITMKLDSRKGSACVRVHDVEPHNVSCARGPINISVKASTKKAFVYIPRSFKGPLQMVTGKTGKVRYSKAVKAQITPISSVNGVHKCFMGEYRLSDWKDEGTSWPGDELRVDAKEAINIYYDDEGDIPTKDTSDEGCIVV